MATTRTTLRTTPHATRAARPRRAAAPVLALAAGALAAGALAAGPAAAQQDGGGGTGAASVETRAAIFAGGCFWCVEQAFDKVPGVVETTSGYTGGSVPDPGYERVSAGGTGHAEAVRVRYDPDRVGYERLLDTFWTNVDPFDAGGQFCDRGDSYRSAVFPLTEAQEQAAERSKQVVAERFDRIIATTIEQPGQFWPAEDYHQDYYEKNPLRYRFYKWNCGREARLEEIWGEDPTGPLALSAETG